MYICILSSMWRVWHVIIQDMVCVLRGPGGGGGGGELAVFVENKI